MKEDTLFWDSIKEINEENDLLIEYIVENAPLTEGEQNEINRRLDGLQDWLEGLDYIFDVKVFDKLNKVD